MLQAKENTILLDLNPYHLTGKIFQIPDAGKFRIIKAVTAANDCIQIEPDREIKTPSAPWVISLANN